MNPTPEQRRQAKGLGFIPQRDGVHFAARIVTGNGVLSARQAQVLGEAADRFGCGKVTFTSRLSVEIPGVSHEDIPAFQAFVAQEGMTVGGTGARVRPVVACKGTVCVYGNIDTQDLAAEIHRRYFEGWHSVTLPHKFKIAVGGCPNNCVKPDLNDVGIIGQRDPAFDSSKCRGCAVCQPERACRSKAWTKAGDKMSIDADRCCDCGACVGKCPFGAVPSGEISCRLTIGGRWGRQIRIGTPLSGRYSEAEALDMIAKVILLYKEQGLPGERLAVMVDRLGIDAVERELAGDGLLERKTAILGE